MNSLREQWLVLISTPFYVIVIGIEILMIHFRLKKTFNWKDSLASLYLMLLNSGFDLLFRIVYLSILQYFYVRSFFTWQQAFLYWAIL